MPVQRQAEFTRPGLLQGPDCLGIGTTVLGQDDPDLGLGRLGQTSGQSQAGNAAEQRLQAMAARMVQLMLQSEGQKGAALELVLVLPATTRAGVEFDLVAVQ